MPFRQGSTVDGRIHYCGLVKGEIAMKESNRPGAFHQAAYLVALIFGGVSGWRIGSEMSGAILGIVLAIVGAIVLSSFVGLVASLLGCRMSD